MNLSEQLMAGMSRFNTDLVVNHIGCDADKFAELVDLVLHGEAPLPHRASWALTHCVDKFPFLIEPHKTNIINQLNTFEHTGTVRSMLRSLLKCEFNNEDSGILFDFCAKTLESKSAPIAVKANCMELMYNISMHEPELKPELIYIFEIHLHSNYAGIVSKARILINRLKSKK
jgi:hypothetical protein